MHRILALLRLLTRPRPGLCRCGAPGVCSYETYELLCVRCAMRIEEARMRR